jgi:hypothetical protein
MPVPHIFLGKASVDRINQCTVRQRWSHIDALYLVAVAASMAY